MIAEGAKVKELLPNTCEEIGCGNPATYQQEMHTWPGKGWLPVVSYRCWKHSRDCIAEPYFQVYSLKTDKRILHAYDA